ncbi:MAG: folate-binding protein [Betaproteobacteria bacterium]|nr:folate-binding protein [Betaproteobacteria bacterium]
MTCQGWSALHDWGVIQVRGADAATFLQQQLSQDFLLVPAHTARLAAYCSPKGRMLASVVAIPVEEGQDPGQRQWKVTLTDASADWQVWGAVGHTASATLAAAGLPADAPAWTCLDKVAPWPSSCVATVLPPAPQCPRLLLLCPSSQPLPNDLTMAPPHTWDWAEVASGIAHVPALHTEAFVPQMLNFESVGGVSFKKGCYPGQEVVARSQFRGAIKRRTVRASAALPLHPGDEVYEPGQAREPVGVVVQSAPPCADGLPHVALVCVQTEAMALPQLSLGQADGPAMTLHGLPYPLLEDI